MAKLWQKSGTKLHPAIEKYTVGTDDVFDMELMPFDIVASKAHARGLQKIGILASTELKRLESGLSAFEEEYAKGNIRITIADEDCHTVIENFLTEKLGDVGKKIHTGRSRNDQVLVALRLYMKHHLALLKKQVLALASEFLAQAERYQDIPIPGYSHTQQAMLSTVGHFYSAHAEGLIDDAEFIGRVLEQIDKSPLGAAAGFGVSIPLDREFTAKELGFRNIQLNSLYCHTSRGKFESLYMETLAQVMLTLGRFANDMILFTAQEFGYFEADDSVVTGSSIMPHKRNLDPMEILRGNVSVVIASQLMVKDIAKNLVSGYNRDGQLIKKPVFESTNIVIDSVEVAGLVLKALTPKPDVIRAKIHKGIFTADIANDLVTKEGMPFRDAYKQAAEMPIGDIGLPQNIASKKSFGAPGNIGLAHLKARIGQLL